MAKKIQFYKQLDQMDCGPTCLRMVAKFHGMTVSVDDLRDRAYITREGVSFSGLAEAAEGIGFSAMAFNIGFESLKNDVPLPCIAYWRQRHFVVVHAIDKKYVHVADPAFGMIRYSHEDFKKSWLPYRGTRQEDEGLIMAIEPGSDFSPDIFAEKVTTKNKFAFLFKYFKPHNKYIVQLFLSLIIGTLLQLVFPFLAQVVVDKGVNLRDLNFIYLILIAQLTLFISGTLVDIIRAWILLNITSRINIQLVSDFIKKLMRLPVSFFESKNMGDLLNRMQDHQRIANLLSTSSLSVIFGIVNIILFGMVLAFFNMTVFFVFLAGSCLYVTWVMLFMKRRALLDYQYFDQSSGNQSGFLSIINGMQEIKLNNSEKKHRWQWEASKIRLFNLSVKNLSLAQIQNIGGVFINEIKNIIITFLSARAVINGELSIGGMMSVQYILGQLNSPINNLIVFIQTLQTALISVERVSEIHDKEDEDDVTQTKLTTLKADKSIIFQNVSFRYGASNMPLVLNNLNFMIPQGKVTAIVGASGSGKTTLLKILLRFYAVNEGTILVGNSNIHNYNIQFWRSKCGIVMQDGFLFPDSIAKNIAESEVDNAIDKERLYHAAHIANLTEFIESLPMGYNTKIGSNGANLSGGQKQRILIARAVYKNPDFLFFDEATSALDANNEKVIMQNLEEFYKGKTVIIVAHRLSTVKNADKIIVLEKGAIREEGSHINLVDKRELYYTLIKNQLELGN
ncbi:ABC transporter ATP-binding protein [Sphingobacteriaceae bacterium]|nr:ABC transporter ATP-binding protein [Sphingobacteriaceae bacterium]